MQTEDLLKEAAEIFGSCIDLLADSSAGSPPDHQVHIQMSISSDQAAPKWQGDESYTLSIQTHNAVTWVHVVAGNFFGARHGLETLSQLIAWDDLIGHYLIMTDATIGDSPAFPHRGLLIDTSRNYVNVATIKRIIDAMAYDKLNVLHWHLTDTHSFPFISQREPLLAIYGAYSPSQVYDLRSVPLLCRGIFWRQNHSMYRNSNSIRVKNVKLCTLIIQLMLYLRSKFGIDSINCFRDKNCFVTFEFIR